MVFLGSQAIASPIWGLIAQHSGLRVAVLAAAALVGLSAAPLREYRQPCNDTGQRSVERLGSVENRMLGMHVGSHNTG